MSMTIPAALLVNCRLVTALTIPIAGALAGSIYFQDDILPGRQDWQANATRVLVGAIGSLAIATMTIGIKVLGYTSFSSGSLALIGVGATFYLINKHFIHHPEIKKVADTAFLFFVLAAPAVFINATIGYNAHMGLVNRYGPNFIVV